MRFTVPVTVFLLLIKNNKVLLMRRHNTGWDDGRYDLVSGHIDGGEYLSEALLRESQEEIGINFNASAAQLICTLHYIGAKEYLYVVFKVEEWEGEPQIMEPEKCDDLQWFSLSALPSNMTLGAKEILKAYKNGGSARYIELRPEEHSA